ncbi:MAG TPA: cobyrinate a,c-diamide synthase [Stellaceae bacterium]|nr:cobyrinate a,c-diamide synthase [Stellaceae bacterium]
MSTLKDSGTLKGLILAAPASGSGKTTITLGLLRCLRQRGVAAIGAKTGPDYIDPGFHAAASGLPSINLDPWAMRTGTIHRLVKGMTGAEVVLCEGVMGLFDGAGTHADKGSTADLAALTDWPVVLVIDVQGQSASVAALVNGFVNHRRDVDVRGVILNRVGSDRHEVMLRHALERSRIPVLGAVRRVDAIKVPSRHLGLVQATEHRDLEAFLDQAAELVAHSVNIDLLLSWVAAPALPGATNPPPPPLGQRIAVARDDAFRFAYAHLLAGWREQGAELHFFSPLDDEAPAPSADAIFLPGGYPELYAGWLAGADRFRGGMIAAAESGTLIYGECGGYMVLGDGLIDASGTGHAMLGLLPVSTSMVEAKRCLGYRQAVGLDGPWAGQRWRGHEFHFARITGTGDAPTLWRITDADGLGETVAGHRRGSVSGAFLHLIDRTE